jgi:hypothetical protein
MKVHYTKDAQSQKRKTEIFAFALLQILCQTL